MATFNFYWLQNTPNKQCSFLALTQHSIRTVFQSKRGMWSHRVSFTIIMLLKYKKICVVRLTLPNKLGTVGRLIFLVYFLLINGADEIYQRV
jgi:hypothetical protein